MSDIVACAIGYVLASSLRWWWAVVFFFLIEILLLATVRDNLTLNIIMLVFPIDAIKQWQVS
jgi:hypothetical protein